MLRRILPPYDRFRYGEVTPDVSFAAMEMAAESGDGRLVTYVRGRKWL
ncbi:MAG TPA: hypothetical protein VE998_00480 [Terriglobales bacterium]|nr:hypothetical protein [Terriglobales bacterium]